MPHYNYLSRAETESPCYMYVHVSFHFTTLFSSLNFLKWCYLATLYIHIPWVPEVIIFFLRAKRASNAAKTRQRGAKRREKMPSEPAKRLIFSPTIRQRASGTRVTFTLPSDFSCSGKSQTLYPCQCFFNPDLALLI